MLLWFFCASTSCATLVEEEGTWKWKVVCFCVFYSFFSSKRRRCLSAVSRTNKNSTTTINLSHVKRWRTLLLGWFRLKVNQMVYLEQKATNDLSWDEKCLARCSWRLTAHRPLSPAAFRNNHPRRHQQCSRSVELGSCCCLSIQWRTSVLGHGCRSFWDNQVACCRRWGKSRRDRSESQCHWLSSWCESLPHSRRPYGLVWHRRFWVKRVDQLGRDRWLCWFDRSALLCQRYQRCELKIYFENRKFTTAQLNSPPRLNPATVSSSNLKTPLSWRKSMNSARTLPVGSTRFLAVM